MILITKILNLVKIMAPKALAFLKMVWAKFQALSTKAKKAVLLALLIMLLIFTAGIKIGNWFNAHFGKKPVIYTTQPVKPTLKPDEKEKIVIENGRTTITTPTGTQTTTGSRRDTIVVKKDGKIEIKSKTIGLCFEPGISASIADNGPRIGIDADVFFYHRLDLIVGVGFGRTLPDTRGYVALGYTPNYSWLTNTDLFVGVTTNKAPIAGIRVRF